MLLLNCVVVRLIVALVLCYLVIGLLSVTRRAVVLVGASPLVWILISCRWVCRRFRVLHSVFVRRQTLCFILAVLGSAWDWASAAKLVKWIPTDIACVI